MIISLVILFLFSQQTDGYSAGDCACSVNGNKPILSLQDKYTTFRKMGPNECLPIINGSPGEAWVTVNYTFDVLVSHLSSAGYIPVDENLAVAKCDYLKSPKTVTCPSGQVQVGGQCYQNNNPVQQCSQNVCPSGTTCVALLSEHIRGLYCVCDTSGDPVQAALKGDCGCPANHVKNINGSCAGLNQCQVSSLCGHGLCTSNYTADGCKCDVGWSGSHCSQAKTLCGSRYCIHGSCDTSSGTPECICDQFWAGQSCDECGGVSCMYGTCLNFPNGTSLCHCDNGITGPHCDQVHHSCTGVSIGGHCYQSVDDDNCAINICFGTEQCKVIKTYSSNIQIGAYCTCDEAHYNPTTCRCKKNEFRDINGNCSATCFPGGAIVQLEDGSLIPIANLKIGDFVLTLGDENKAKFSEVILMLHSDKDSKLQYLTIYTEGAKSIRISANHVIFTGRFRNETFSSRFAGSVRPGEFLRRWSSSEKKFEVVKIVKIVRSKMQGLFAPLTMDGSLVVDGHHVSSYAVYDDHDFVHSLFTPWRLLHQLKSMIWSSPPFKPEQKGIHWSVGIIPRVLCSLYWTDYCHDMGGTINAY